jgi:hypothetical protein
MHIYNSSLHKKMGDCPALSAVVQNYRAVRSSNQNWQEQGFGAGKKLDPAYPNKRPTPMHTGKPENKRREAT